MLKRTAHVREGNSRGHSPVRSLRGQAVRPCQESELAEKKEGKPLNHLFLHQRSLLVYRWVVHAGGYSHFNGQVLMGGGFRQDVCN